MGPLKILYIAHNANNRHLVERLLLAKGYDIYRADDGLARLGLARHIRPALVLAEMKMDLIMLPMNASILCEATLAEKS